MNDNLIHRNPLDRIKVAKPADRRYQAKSRIDPYSITEIHHLIDTAKRECPEWWPYWQFAFFTGLRPSEQYALKYENIDWVRQEMLINAAVVERQDQPVKTKSSESVVPILPMAMIALRAQQKLTADSYDHVYINPRTQNRILDYEETASVLRELCQKAGIRFRPQRQTRHSFASNLLIDGEDPVTVAELMRHRDLEMLMKVYAKPMKAGADGRRRFKSKYANLKTFEALGSE